MRLPFLQRWIWFFLLCRQQTLKPKCSSLKYPISTDAIPLQTDASWEIFGMWPGCKLETLHLGLHYLAPKYHLSLDTESERRETTSNPVILTLCDLESQIPYNQGMTHPAGKGECMDMSGKTTEKGFFWRRWRLGTRSISELHTWSTSIYLPLNLASLFTSTVLQRRKLGQETKACDKGCQSWMDWNSLGLKKLWGSHSWSGLLHIWCCNGLFCCPPAAWQKASEWFSSQGGDWTLWGITGQGLEAQECLTPALPTSPPPFSSLDCWVHKNQNQQENQSPGEAMSLSLWLADWWKVSFKEWNHKKPTYPNLS